MTGTAVRPGLRDYASLVRLSHSVFALPFALLALLVAAGGAPPLRTLVLVVTAVVAARTAAMAWNRWADRRIDALNTRTAQREIPTGRVTPRQALLLCGGAAALFLGCCWLLGPVCFWLGIPVLAWLLLYSYSKRFTWLCHLWLGVALGLAPVAAWVAARGALGADTWTAVLLGGAVAFWVAGFDILYACQDESFDRAQGLQSLPARFGQRAAMALARGSHLLAAAGFAWFGVRAGLGWCYQAGVLAAAALLVWQHRLVRPGELGRLQQAFFVANGALSIAMFAAACVDLYVAVG